jgi:ubiquitin C-terminal hydrolase
VDTTKRTVFAKLPPTLIFNLKRFEMNFEVRHTMDTRQQDAEHAEGKTETSEGGAGD